MQLGVIDFSERHANIGTLFWATVCDQGGHIVDDCPINVLSPEQATHIFGSSSNFG